MENLSENTNGNNANTVLVADLTCTMCKDIKKTYSEIVYSQGSRVCLDCKKITLESDKKAFDRDMRYR